MTHPLLVLVVAVTKTEISSALNNNTTHKSWEGFCVRRRSAGQAVKFWGCWSGRLLYVGLELGLS